MDPEPTYKDFALYNNDGVVRYTNEVDQVLSQQKEVYTPADFNHFDLSHYCEHDYVVPYLDSLNIQDMVAYDFGCGIGGTTRLLAAKYAQRVYGFDYLQGYLDVHQRINEACNIQNVTLFQGDGTKTTAEDIGIANTVDFAVTIQVLIHITDKLPAFRHVFGALKPGGVWYIEDFGRKDGTELDDEELKLCRVGEWNSLPSRSKFIQLLEEAGFVVESFIDRSKEWSRYICYRANGHLENEAQLRARGGDKWYEQFCKEWSVETIFKLFHDLDMTIEEVEATYPYLFNYHGRQQFEHYLSLPQKLSGNYIVARKPAS